MSSRTIRFNFKLVYTSKTWELDVNSEMSLIDFNRWLTESHRIRHSLFNINDHYILEIVACGNNINGDAELAPAIEPTHETVGEKFNPRNTAFYIRPIDPITQEFIQKDDYSVAP